MTEKELKGRWTTPDRKYSILFSLIEEGEINQLQFSAPNELTKGYNFKLESGILTFDSNAIQLLTANNRTIKLLYKKNQLLFTKIR